MKSNGAKQKKGRRGTQADFFANGSEFRPGKTFGGSDLKGNPRTERPFSSKKAVHLVMKSKFAVGEQSMWRKPNKAAIESCVRNQAKNSGTKLYSFVNVGNHLHIVIKAERRADYRRFVRAISGVIARIVLKRERGPIEATISSSRESVRGREVSARERFWDARPFTRIVEWGRDFTHLTGYILKNRLEAFGFSEKSARYYADLLRAGLVPSRGG